MSTTDPVATATTKTVRFFFRAFATTEFGESPSYMRIDLTRDCLDRIQSAMDVARQHNFDSVLIEEYPTWGPESTAEDLRLRDDKLHVGAYGFVYWSAHPKHAAYDVESDGLNFAELKAIFDAAPDRGVVFHYLAEERGEIEDELGDDARAGWIDREEEAIA